MRRQVITYSVLVFCAVAAIIVMISCGSHQESKLLIGCISPFSGDGAVYGQELKRGFNIFLDELRARDSSFYSRIEIIYEDDRLDEGAAVNALNKLINLDGVQVVIGAFTSNTTLAIAPIAEEKQIVLLTPTATNYRIKDAGDFIFRVTPSDAYQGRVLASFVLDSLQKTRVCILYMNTDYGVGLRDVFRESFEAQGGTVLSSEGFDMGASDMRTQLQKIKTLNPDVVYLPSNYNEAVHVLRQAKELGIRAQFVCTDGVFEQEFLRLAGDAGEGMFVSTMAWGTGRYAKEADSFRETYRSKYGHEPGVYSALCYDALSVVVDALSRAEYSSTAIRDALYQTQLVGATGLNKFDRNGEVEKDFDIYRVTDNRFGRLGE